MSWINVHVFPLSGRVKATLACFALLIVAVWLTFFDSHSIANRIHWNREIAKIEAENSALREETAALEEKLKGAKSDALIEQIAREEYGMRKPGERVYRVKSKP